MRKINIQKCLSFETLVHNRKCIVCGEDSTCHLYYAGFLQRGTLPLCTRCHRKFVSGEIQI